MTDRDLSLREIHVLDIIVRNYISSAAPTGSRFIARQPGFELSSASIRNVMLDLEEMGYLTHPHTSAGRVPTDKGYRYYVDRLMTSMQLPMQIQSQIQEEIQRVDPSDLHLLLEAATKALSRTTRLFGVTLAPRLNEGIFRHAHIYAMEKNRFFMHVTIDAGFVKTLVIELETQIPTERLDSACRIINDRFNGLTLGELCRSGEDVFCDVEPCELGVIRLFVPSIKRLLSTDPGDEVVYTDGETNILLQPEFFSREKAGAIVEILAEKQILMHILDKGTACEGKVVVSIGGEIDEGQFSSFSIVKTTYKLGNMEGILGIMGPKRMPYPLLVSAVDYTARTLRERHC